MLAVWVGADQKIIELLCGAGIPNYPTEDDAVRGFMHLVRHREVVEALSQVPPAMPDTFVPDAEAARQIVTARARRRPLLARTRSRSSACSMPTTSRWCRPLPPPMPKQAVAHANELFAQGATVVLQDHVARHRAQIRCRRRRSQPDHAGRRARAASRHSGAGEERCGRRRGFPA